MDLPARGVVGYNSNIPAMGKLPRYPEYATRVSRLESFDGWMHEHTQSARALSDAGFFWTENDDEVQCYHCGGGLRRLAPGEDPLEMHYRWFPGCHLVRQLREESLIERSVDIAESEPTNADIAETMLLPTEDQPATVAEMEAKLNTQWNLLLRNLAGKIETQAALTDFGANCTAPRQETVQALANFPGSPRRVAREFVTSIAQAYLEGPKFDRLMAMRRAFTNMGQYDDFESAMAHSGLNTLDYFGPDSPFRQEYQASPTSPPVEELKEQLEERWGTVLNQLSAVIQNSEEFHDLGKYSGLSLNDRLETLRNNPKDLGSATWTLLCKVTRNMMLEDRVSKLKKLGKAFQFAGRGVEFRRALHGSGLDPENFVPTPSSSDLPIAERMLNDQWEALLEGIAFRLCGHQAMTNFALALRMPLDEITIIQQDYPHDCLTVARLVMRRLQRDYMEGDKIQRLRAMREAAREIQWNNLLVTEADKLGLTLSDYLP